MPKVRISVTKLQQTLYEVDLTEDEIDQLNEGEITTESVLLRAIVLQSSENLENEEIFMEDDIDFNAYFIQ